MPDRPFRDLRELTRYRRSLVETQASERQRLIKLLEGTGIKLAGVLSDVFGVSGRAIVRALIAGTDTPQQMAALARGTARSKEIALRLAVGASRWRIVRQLLCEGLLLAICGGLVGLVVSVWCNDLLLHSLARLLGSMNFSFVVKLRPDATVLAVTLLFCLIATMHFSLGPALKATKADLVNDLKQQAGEPARIGRLVASSRPVTSRSWHKLRFRSCCCSAPAYFSEALLRRADLIPVLLQPAIWLPSWISH